TLREFEREHALAATRVEDRVVATIRRGQHSTQPDAQPVRGRAEHARVEALELAALDVERELGTGETLHATSTQFSRLHASAHDIHPWHQRSSRIFVRNCLRFW